jgi:uncharacterized protein YycO
MNQQHHTRGHVPEDTRIGDVIACRSTGFSPLSWLIRKRSASQVNHVASCVDYGILIEALGGGVKMTVAESLKMQWWIHLRPNTISDAQAEQIYVFLHEQLGKPYDWGAIAGFGPWSSYDNENGNPSKWFCSELVWASFKRAGISLCRRPNSYVYPCDILESPRLEIVGYQWPQSLMQWIED